MVFVIIVYDVNVKRVVQIHKFLKGYLHWKQNSVFEGKLSEGELQIVINGIEDIVDPGSDMVLIYIAESEKYLDTKLIGVENRTKTFVF